MKGGAADEPQVPLLSLQMGEEVAEQCVIIIICQICHSAVMCRWL